MIMQLMIKNHNWFRNLDSFYLLVMYFQILEKFKLANVVSNLVRPQGFEPRTF